MEDVITAVNEIDLTPVLDGLSALQCGIDALNASVLVLSGIVLGVAILLLLGVLFRD